MLQDYVWYTTYTFWRETHCRNSVMFISLASVLLMRLIPPCIVLVSKSVSFIIAVNIIFMDTVEPYLLSSSVNRIQTAALEGNTFYAAHAVKEIYISPKSSVSHTHLYLPTFICTTTPSFLFCLIHLSFHPRFLGFLFCVINIFLFLLYEITWHEKRLWRKESKRFDLYL